MTDTINKTEIDALNDVTKVLIDSRKGYEKCANSQMRVLRFAPSSRSAPVIAQH